MSDMPACQVDAGRPLMELSFDLLLWREALAGASPVPTAPELAEWAELLGAAGEDAAQALLGDVAALHQGFSPQAIAARRSVAADFTSVLPASGGDWTLHRAVRELRVLAGVAAPAGRPRLAVPPSPVPSGRPDNPAGIGDGIPAAATIRDVALVARRLRELLEEPFANGAMVVTLLAGLVEADRRLPALDYRAYARAPLGLLVPAIATVALIDFALSTRDLWSAPLGSPALFHHVARLDGAGLGPYLNNVGRLVRDGRDMVDLADIARDAAAQAGDGSADADAWFVLLSRGCRRELLFEIVDNLGDAAAHGPLSAILDRIASRPGAAIDTGLVMRLRDACLDNADHALAARAQQVIVRLRPDDRLESLILASIEASGGAFARAEAIFRHWLALSPADPELRKRLLAVQADRFDDFALPHGYGSPADRRDTRLRRRGVLPDYPRRQGERIRAVDVG